MVGRDGPADVGAVDGPIDQLDGFSRLAGRVGHSSRRLLRSWPWWLQVVLVWLLSRLFTLTWTLVAFSRQGPLGNGASVPSDYFGYASMWDSAFYQRIGEAGYPLAVQPGPGGGQPASEFAFLPGYPFVVRLITEATTLSWPVVATSVSLVACLGFLLIAYRLFRARTDASAAIAATAVVAFATAAPVLQYAYAESLGLLLLAAALLFMDGGRYLLAAAAMVLAGLTRPLGVPLFVTAVIVAGLVLVEARRTGRPMPPARLVGLGVLVLGGLVAAVEWPVLAGFMTGVPDAYLRAEGAWHGGVHPPLLLFLASLAEPLGEPAGAAVSVLVLAGFAALMLSRPVRRLGLVQWAWVGCLLGYLILLTPVSTSTPRLLLPAFPLALAAVEAAGNRWSRGLLVVLGALSQVVWILVLWHLVDGVVDSSP